MDGEGTRKPVAVFRRIGCRDLVSVNGALVLEAATKLDAFYAERHFFAKVSA